MKMIGKTLQVWETKVSGVCNRVHNISVNSHFAHIMPSTSNNLKSI